MQSYEDYLKKFPERARADDFEGNIKKAIRLMVEAEPKYEIRGFRIVKVKLPSDVYEELRRRYQQTIIKQGGKGDLVYVSAYMGIPIEEDKDITNVQYVIEGHIKIL